MKALLQRQWRRSSPSRSLRLPLFKLQDAQPLSVHGTSVNRQQSCQAHAPELWSSHQPLAHSELLVSDQRNFAFFLVQKTLAHPLLSDSCREKSSNPTFLLAQETSGPFFGRRLSESNFAKTENYAQNVHFGCSPHRRILSARDLHTATAKSAETQSLVEPAGSSLDAEDGEEGVIIDTDDEMEVYEELKDYVEKNHPNRPGYARLLEGYNPMAVMKEPTIEEFRRPDRELPPLDRVTIALDTDERYRVTRKTKWVTKQLRSPVMNDVPALLEQWVKTMYPKRSDWLDLLEELNKNEKELNLMFQVFEFALLEDTFEVTSRDLTRIIVKYINLERYDDVDRLMQTLDEKGFPPDFVVSTLLLDMNCKLKRLDKATEMFGQIRSLGYVPDLGACTKLIECYSESGNAEAGEIILAEMEDEKLHGTVETYLAVLKGFAKERRASDAERIFFIMKEDIFLREHIGPNVYSELMNAYVLGNRLSNALMILEDMLLSDMVPEDKSVSMIIAEYEKKNNFEKALNLLLKLESKALRPGVDTLATLIGWFGKLGLVEEAEILFKNIEAKVDVPDGKAYASLFSTYARTGSMDKARAILDCVEEKKVLLNASAYEQMIVALLDVDQREEAQSVRDQMISHGLTPSDAVERKLLGFPAESNVGDEPSEGEGKSLHTETESFLAAVTKRMEEAPESL